MSYELEQVDLTGTFQNLSLQLPSKLAFFPENLESATHPNRFIFTDSIVDLNKLFKQYNINPVYLGGDTELYRTRKNADLYLPALFFSLSLITDNPTIVSVCLNVLSNYISDFLKKSFGLRAAHVDLYFESTENGKVNKISYKGSAEGLKDLDKIIKALK